MSDPNPDWYEWHDRYQLESGSHLVRRLAVVQHALAGALDARPAGPIRVASLCAGQGHDVLGVLDDHRRAGDVTAVLVESDGRNVQATRNRIAQDHGGGHGGGQGGGHGGGHGRGHGGGHGRGTVTVVEGDAGNTSALAEIVPVDVLLLCGMFGNISMADVERTIDATPSLLASDATVIWTRRSVPTDLTPRIRERFADLGFAEVDFVDPDDDKFTVGTHRFDGRPAPFVPDRHLFDFIGYATMIERGE